MGVALFVCISVETGEEKDHDSYLEAQRREPELSKRRAKDER